MSPRPLRFLSIVFVIMVLAPAALAAAIAPQGEAKAETQPVDRVREFAKAVREVERLGGAATAALGAQAKTESTATQNLLNAIGQALKEKAAAAGVDTAPSSVEPQAKRVAAATRDLLGLKDRALEALEAAAKDPENEDVKAFLAKAEGRIYVGLCTSAIRVYLGPNGQSSGTFDGMFAKLDKFNRDKISDAFLDILQSTGQSSGIRLMAGEGLAQMGAARHQPALKAILANTNETADIRQRAQYTLARLGDRTSVDKRLADIASKMAEFKKPDMTVQETRGWAEGYRMSAMIAQNIHDTDASIKFYEQYIAALEAVKDKAGAQSNANNLQTDYYNLACLYSIKGDVEGGFKYLEKAFDAGYVNFKWANTDGDLTNLRKDPRFKAMCEKWESGKGKSESAPASKPS